MGLAAFPASADNLAIGCLLAVIGNKLPRIGKWAAALMLSGIIFLPFYAGSTPARTVFMLLVLRPAFYVSIAGVVLHVVRTPYWILNCAPVVWLGRISYSLYLWQQPFCSDPKLQHGYFVVFAFACACLSYYLVENPILKVRDVLSHHHKVLWQATPSSVAA
jgi:peptidoglycan/LPS O-acetylase OafA/YrhL